MKNLPNIIVAGVVRGGTTSLFTYLSWHPDICVSKVKETKYFSSARYGEELPSIEKYKSFLCNFNNEKYTLEATPGYFYGGRKVAKAIYDNVGHIRIIVILRDPVYRVFSAYRHFKKGLLIDEKITFPEFIEMSEKIYDGERHLKYEKRKTAVFFRGVSGGFYDKFIKEWYSVFGNKLIVLFFEHMRDDPLKFMCDLCNILHLDPTIYNNKVFRAENKSYIYMNKTAHKLAKGTYKKFESVFSKHYTVKNFLRNVYLVINQNKKRSADILFDEEVKGYLENKYLAYNKQLYEFLISNGYTDLPYWLSVFNGKH